MVRLADEFSTASSTHSFNVASVEPNSDVGRTCTIWGIESKAIVGTDKKQQEKIIIIWLVAMYVHN